MQTCTPALLVGVVKTRMLSLKTCTYLLVAEENPLKRCNFKNLHPNNLPDTLSDVNIGSVISHGAEFTTTEAAYDIVFH